VSLLRAMHGSRLYEQPEHAEARARIEEFVAGDGPLGVEIGFDHGMCILDRARRSPEVRWLGLELRKRRVAAVAPHAPPNCLLAAADARTVLHALMPADRIDWLVILFPTPATRAGHALLTPAFVEDLRRVVRGCVHLATDVPDAFPLDLFDAWVPGGTIPPSTELSRRERVCRRDGIPVWSQTWTRP
jgi:tRNA G46 methylase TrmB